MDSVHIVVSAMIKTPPFWEKETKFHCRLNEQQLQRTESTTVSKRSENTGGLRLYERFAAKNKTEKKT